MKVTMIWKKNYFKKRTTLVKEIQMYSSDFKNDSKWKVGEAERNKKQWKPWICGENLINCIDFYCFLGLYFYWLQDDINCWSVPIYLILYCEINASEMRI